MRMWRLLKGAPGAGTNKDDREAEAAVPTVYVLANDHVTLGGQRGSKV